MVGKPQTQSGPGLFTSISHDDLALLRRLGENPYWQKHFYHGFSQLSVVGFGDRRAREPNECPSFTGPHHLLVKKALRTWEEGLLMLRGRLP